MPPWLGGGGAGGAGSQKQETKITIKPDDLNLQGAPQTVGATQISALLGLVYLIAGIVAVVAIIIGSIRFVASNGDSNQVAAAKNIITYAVVGLVVVLAAAAITQFVLENVAK